VSDNDACYYCVNQVELLVMRALSHYLMLPWSGGLPDSEQDWPERAARLTLLFQRNFHDYTMLAKHLAAPSSIDYHGDTSASLSQGMSLMVILIHTRYWFSALMVSIVHLYT